jgi:threonine synthase
MSMTEKSVITEHASQRCIEPLCGARFGVEARLYVCPRCGGLLEIEKDAAEEEEAGGERLKGLWRERRTSMDERDRSGVWRYRELLPFAPEQKVVTLQEGNTPLYDAPRSARFCGLDALALKHQGCNPTGSFKDTGMTTAVTQAVILGARTVVCASTGNTAASLAAYAARAALQCAILVPRGQISHAKLAQSLDYGAVVLELDGNFDDAMRVIRELAEDETIYLVNSINPFRIEGQKTVAAEMLEQRGWRVPDHVVVPGGNLGNSSALGKGFKELYELGLIDKLPRLSVVQAEGAAPFAGLFASDRIISELKSSEPAHMPDELLAPVAHPQTLATAIKIGAPVSWKKALRAVLLTGGSVLTVSEQEIADAKAVIGRDGVGCEPASATTLAGLKRLVAGKLVRPDEDVVAVLTGHVLKDTDYAINYHRETLYTHDRSSAKTKEERHLSSTYSNPASRVRADKDAILETLRRREQGAADLRAFMPERIKTRRVESESLIACEDDLKDEPSRSFEVRVPASTSNLGAGFDCFGLALQLHLTVRATAVPGSHAPCRVRSSRGSVAGQALSSQPDTQDNLIFRAMHFAAEREGLSLPPVRLAVHNPLPMGRGLGSSAAAILAGIRLCSSLCERPLSTETVLRYAFEMEGHADNVAAALYGGWVVTCVREASQVLVVKRRWPSDLKVIVVSPDVPLNTAEARSALPHTVSREDAVYNLQRATLFVAALDAARYDLLWEAMQDRLHQSHRQPLVAGLSDALATRRRPGLVGLALSGSGPSVVALASADFDELGDEIAAGFRRRGVEATVRLLEVDNEGLKAEKVR